MKIQDVAWREITDDAYLSHPDCQIIVKHGDFYVIRYANEIGVNDKGKIVANFGDCQVVEVTHYAFID